MFSHLFIAVALVQPGLKTTSPLPPQRRAAASRQNKDLNPWSRHVDAKEWFKDTQVQQLCTAIAKGDLDVVKELLKNDVDVNARGSLDATPLIWCFPNTDNGIFELLLRSGADPNVRFMGQLPASPPMRGRTATMMAANYGSVAALRLVLDYKGNPQDRFVFERAKETWGAPIGSSCLLLASLSYDDPIARVRLLLERGADPNDVWFGPQCRSAFTEVLRKDRFELALVLLAGGANPKLYDFMNFLPCHYLSEDLEDIAKATPADRERILLLVEKVKRLGAWHPEAAAERSKYQQLFNAKQYRAALEYARQLRDKAKKK